MVGEVRLLTEMCVIVRHSAKELTSLILDEERLRAERANRGSWKSRVSGLEDVPGGYIPPSSHPQAARRPRRATAPSGSGGGDDNDLEYRLALEASMNEAAEDEKRRAGKSGTGEEGDDDLAKAIKLSKEEEELRKRELEDQNQSNLLFDDTPATEVPPQPTGFNQGYQQQPQVDWFGNPVQQQQQQPQQTGFLNNAYSQPTGGFQNGGLYGNYGQQQPQQTGYEQMQQPAQQFLQPQNTYNPWAQSMQQPQQQQNGFQQQQDQQPVAQAQSNNPWASTNQTGAIGAQPTGSNNPFATQRPQQHSVSAFRAPTLNTLAEQSSTNQFNSRPNPITTFSAPSVPQAASPIQQQQQRLPSPLSQQSRMSPPVDPYQAKLNALLASGEGQDTFGNVGDSRIPAQHTAPGTFVNSAGAGSMGRLEASKTGTNPFFSQAPAQYPAQTGPVGGFGGSGGLSSGYGGSSNPFGSRPPGQQQQGGYGGQQGGSLIDL